MGAFACSGLARNDDIDMPQEEESALLPDGNRGMEEECTLGRRSESIDQHRGIIHCKTDMGFSREELNRRPVLAADHRAYGFGIAVHGYQEEPLTVPAVHLNTRHIIVRTIGINRLPSFGSR